MSEFLFIFINVMLPIAIIVIIGYVVQLRFKLERATLAKLMINYIMPVFIFMNLFEADMELTLLMSVLLFLILYAALTFLLTYFVGRAMGLDPGHQILFTNSNLFYNAGNYGVPVNDLVFRSDPFAMSVQIMMVFFQNMFAYSYGVVSLRARESGKWKALLGYFKMPIFYGLALGLIFNFFNIGVPASVYISFDYISDAMIGTVLFILGAQIAGISFKRIRISSIAASFIRLIIGPALTIVLLLLFNLTGVVAQAILITTAMPSAVNSTIIAQQYSDDPEYAAEIVMFSTLFSVVTVPLVIYIALNVF
ncbi:AEC family transporter [Salinicoccus sp. Marseille-QA3877]